MKSMHEHETMRYVLHVRGIFPPASESPEDEGSLLATQYSFLRRTPVFRLEHVMERISNIDDKELLLHFQDFDSMGERNDATVIPVKDIIDVNLVEIDQLGPFERLQYTVDIPDGEYSSVDGQRLTYTDLSQLGLFCRFGVRCGGSEDSACLTPVASHLLPRSRQWTKPSYRYLPQPMVMDFSPGVVGLSEGFQQAGYAIHAGVGFDPESHFTWKVSMHIHLP